MGRKVKCRVTGEYGDSDIFIKKGNHYFKSLEAYEQYENDLKCKDRAISIIAKDLLGYEERQPYPSYLFKLYKQLDFYSNEIILKTILEKYETLKFYADNKPFSNESGKLSYLFAIIKNNIAEIDKREKKRSKFLENVLPQYEEKLTAVAESLNTLGQFHEPGRLSQRNISEFLNRESDA